MDSWANKGLISFCGSGKRYAALVGEKVWVWVIFFIWEAGQVSGWEGRNGEETERDSHKRGESMGRDGSRVGATGIKRRRRPGGR